MKDDKDLKDQPKDENIHDTEEPVQPLGGEEPPPLLPPADGSTEGPGKGK